MIGFYGKLPPRHEQQILFEDRYVCITRKGHPRVGQRLTLARYVTLDHVVVSQSKGGMASVEVALAALGMERRVGVRVSHS